MKARVLFVHNTYQQRGGEDSVVDAEIAMLRAHGHEVETFFRSNDELAGMSSPALLRQTLWSDRTGAELAEIVSRFRPDVIHSHNTFPLISPSLYWAAERLGVPIVQTLHNFRLMCLNALFLRQGKVCEDCMGKFPWRGVVRACYRHSPAASTALTGMLSLHRAIGTWGTKVTRYIALNEFCRSKFIAGGLPAEKIVVKPNFVASGMPSESDRSDFLFAGRLAPEKGIDVLASALSFLPDMKVLIAGDGPSRIGLENIKQIKFLGRLPSADLFQAMSCARAVIIPSICYETFGMVVIESFAAGAPVIASRIGALAELVEDGVNGLLFEAGNAKDLAEKMAWARQHPEQMAEMGRNARLRYEAEFTEERNHALLTEIYQDAIDSIKA